MLKIEDNKPVIYKESTSLGVLIFKEIDKNLARDMCIKYHYAHRWSTYNTYFGMFNVGVFKQDDLNKCLGCAVFGHLMNSNSYKNISDDITKDEIYELNRLWIDDCLGKNAESMLLSACWKILRFYKKIKVIQSFADGRLGCGTIYKASSFKYYGCSNSIFFKHKNSNETYFESCFHNTRIPKQLCKLVTLYCKNELEVYSPKSYRYIYTLDNNINIKLKQMEYPKYCKECKQIDSSYILIHEFPAIIRGYIISKVFNINMGSSFYISNFLLNNVEHEKLNSSIVEQLNNKMLNKKLISQTSFKLLVGIKDWIPILIEDSTREIKEFKKINLF